MSEINNFNFDILSLLLTELKRQGKENLSTEELTKEYKDFVIIYQQFQEMSIEATKYGIDASKVWKSTHSLRTAVEQLNALIEKANEYTTLKKLEEEIEQKLELLIKTKKDSSFFHGYNAFSSEYMIITTSNIPRAEKINKLRELLNKINPYCSELQNIKSSNQIAVQKIKEIESLFSANKHFLSMYNGKKEITRLQDELKIILQNNNVNEILQNLSDFIKYLDEFKNKLKKLSSFYQYYKRPVYDGLEAYYAHYNICGIRIDIDIEKKTYFIDEKYLDMKMLKNCKINQIIEFLTKKIKMLQTDEFIKPTIINEKTMSEYMKKKKLPLQDILKGSIDNFQRSLGINTELRKYMSTEQIMALSTDSQLQDLFSFIGLLESQGFTIKKLKTPKPSLAETITKRYQSIDLESIGQTEIYKIISEIIKSTHPVEQYIFSTLQIVYNCIDRNLIKQMHQELNSKASVEESHNLKQVVEIMSRYARKENGEEYTEEEIITFIQNKNITINSDYRFDDLSEEEYPTDGYEEVTNMSDINAVIFKMTGRSH